MIWKPHATVAAVIENEGRFLLVQELISGRSVYNQPAGHLEDDETLIEAVIRETREETAWEFLPESLIGIYQWRHPENGETFMRTTFSGNALHHDQDRELDACIQRTLWLTPEEIRNQHDRLRSPMVLRTIEDYLAGVRYPLALLSPID